LQLKIKDLFYNLFNYCHDINNNHNNIEFINNSINNIINFFSNNSQQLLLNDIQLKDFKLYLFSFFDSFKLIIDKFNKGCNVLFNNFEEYMTNVQPSSSLLPINITVKLKGRKQFWDLQLKYHNKL